MDAAIMASVTETSPGTAAAPAKSDARRGFLFALSAYLFWGVLPLFLKPLAHVPALEVLAHRIVWSVPLAGVILVALGRTADLKVAFRSPRTLAMAAFTACLITVNWGVYVWAIATDNAVEAALGYYINPLVNVVIAYFLLGERLSRLQVMAVALAVVAVAILAMDAGGLPWASLALGVSFGFYGYFKKTLPIGPSQGFFLEVLILFLPCLAYILWLQARGEGHFLTSRPADMGWLMFTGVVTTVPLILFAYGARLLRYSTVGIMQYLAPTIVFLIAVFVFHEPFSTVKAAAFALIWAALALYTWSMLAAARKAG
jgi:chloramphenicol-sensitive protein RarD